MNRKPHSIDRMYTHGCLAVTCLLLIMVTAAMNSSAMAATDTATWIGSISNNWNDPGNWSGNAVPQNMGGTTFDVFIDSDSALSSTVINNLSPTIDSLNITAGDRLTFPDSQDVTLLGTGDALINNGEIVLEAFASLTEIIVTDGTTIAGIGTIDMGLSSQGRIRLLAPGTFTIGPGQVISGTGTYVAGTGSMVNQGTINASGFLPTILLPSASGSITNDGSINATGTGGLSFSGTLFNNTTIHVANGSQVNMFSGSDLVGGTLTTAGNGFFGVTSTGANASLTDVTLDGRFRMINGNDLLLVNSFTNNGLLSMEAANSLTDLFITSGSTINGNGAIELSNSENNRILIEPLAVAVSFDSIGSAITNGNSHAIRGSGTLLPTGGSLINHGKIIADSSAGMTLAAGNLVNQAGGSITVDTQFTIASSAQLINEIGSKVQGQGTLRPIGAFINNGQLAPGNHAPASDHEIGTLTIDGNYVGNPTAALTIQIAGIAGAGQPLGHDQLIVTGTNINNGNLIIELLNFLPDAADTFRILQANASNGFFLNETGGIITTAEGYQFDVIYTATYVELTNFNPIPEPSVVALVALASAIFFSVKFRNIRR